MELTFLGTSAAVPTNHRNHSAIALKAFGEIILFDCGEGTQRQMFRAKLSPMKIKKILITHLHGDHFLGLPGMIQSMAFRGRQDPLHIFGPPGLSETVNYIENLGYFSLTFPLKPHEIHSDLVFEDQNYRLTSFPMEHSVLNLAYCIEEKRGPKFLKDQALKLGLEPGPDFGKLQQGIPVTIKDKIIKPEQVLGKERKGRKIVYSGDTRPSPDMIKFAHKSDVLIHEATFQNLHQDKALETGHSTAAEAAGIAKAAQVKLLIVTHISTRYRETGLLEKEAKEVFEKSLVAEDLINLEVKRGAD
jgi:ribonuclease Z